MDSRTQPSAPIDIVPMGSRLCRGFDRIITVPRQHNLTDIYPTGYVYHGTDSGSRRAGALLPDKSRSVILELHRHGTDEFPWYKGKWKHPRPSD
ncbi:hypothetical protein AALT_g3663 [Alternaria alternata]|nr:hypothetical protein AALT_g3663 [Alternaria alternata]